METVLVVVALLACPLMMLAMGGMAWVAARSRRDRPQRLGDVAQQAGCMSHAAHARRPTSGHPDLAGPEAADEHEATAPPSSQNRAGSASAGV